MPECVRAALDTVNTGGAEGLTHMNAIVSTTVTTPSRPVPAVIDCSTLRTCQVRAVSPVRARVRGNRRGKGAESAGHEFAGMTVVVVPDTIRSAAAVRLLVAHVKHFFHLEVTACGQVRTISVRLARREELEKSLRGFANCFC